MRSGLITKKVGMTSKFTEFGERLALTVLSVEDSQVVELLTEEKNGYNSVLVGAFNAKKSRVNKPQLSFFAKHKVEPKTQLKEFRVDGANLLEKNDVINVDHFKEGQFVDVTSKSIGKGFAGVMKRHNFAGLEATHGVSVSHRSHGSTGQCQDPGKVFKGKKMAGRLGGKKATIQNLEVVEINAEKGLLFVKGSVPGAKGSYVLVKDAVKKS